MAQLPVSGEKSKDVSDPEQRINAEKPLFIKGFYRKLFLSAVSVEQGRAGHHKEAVNRRHPPAAVYRAMERIHGTADGKGEMIDHDQDGRSHPDQIQIK